MFSYGKQIYLDSKSDLKWLRDVHKVNTKGYVAAVITCNEDVPEKIELYKTRDYRETPVVINF